MLTANKLINKALRRCFWPADSGTGLGSNAPLSDADILELADEEIAGQLKPQQLTVQGDYDLATLDYAITADQTLYRLPARCFGPVQDVIEVQTDTAQSELSMPIASLEDIARPERLRLRSRTQYLAVVDGEYLRIYPNPTTTDGKLLRIRYFRQPNKLALLATAGKVTARSTVVVLGVPIDQITLDTAITFSSATPADCISGGNAHSAIVFDAIPTSAAAGTAAINLNTHPTGWGDAAIGDYIALAGYTPIVQIPEIMESLLVLRVAAAMLEANGELEAAQRMEVMANQRSDQVEQLLKPRVAAEPKYIITRNSVLRSGSIRGRMW